LHPQASGWSLELSATHAPFPAWRELGAGSPRGLRGWQGLSGVHVSARAVLRDASLMSDSHSVDPHLATLALAASRRSDSR
jgi:hypothetical protein